MTRRTLLAGGVRPNRRWLKDEYHHWFGPHAHTPSAPEGVVRLDHVYSHARGRTVDLFTAVPHGYGAGQGLPACLVLHRRPVEWGWSMGGYGVMRLGEVRPGWLRAVAAFSPDVTHSPRLVADDAVYSTTPLGVWCGRSDALYADVRGFVAKLPRRPHVLSYGAGAHTRAYWDSVTLPAFAFLGAEIAKGAAP